MPVSSPQMIQVFPVLKVKAETGLTGSLQIGKRIVYARGLKAKEWVWEVLQDTFKQPSHPQEAWA